MESLSVRSAAATCDGGFMLAESGLVVRSFVAASAIMMPVLTAALWRTLPEWGGTPGSWLTYKDTLDKVCSGRHLCESTRAFSSLRVSVI